MTAARSFVMYHGVLPVNPDTNKKGADLTRPALRHREAPFQKARQAAPDLGATSLVSEKAGKIRGFQGSP